MFNSFILTNLGSGLLAELVVVRGLFRTFWISAVTSQPTETMRTQPIR